MVTPENSPSTDPSKEREENIHNPIQYPTNCGDTMEWEKKVVKDITDMFDVWDTWRRPFENLWNQIYRMYFSNVDSSKTTTRAKIFVPVVFQVIESTIPKIMNVLFGAEEFWDAIPESKDEQPKVDVSKLLINYQLMQSDFFVKFMDFTKQLLLYGTSYFLVFWRTERKWVWSRTPIREDVNILGFKMGSRIVGWKENKEYKVTFRGPDMEVLDILDVWPDPTSPNEKKGKGVFVRTYEDIDALKEMGKGRFPVYSNTDSEELKSKTVSMSNSRQSRLSSRGTTQPMKDIGGGTEIHSFYGLYDLDGDGIREEVQIVIGNKKVLLKAQSNPFHHGKRPVIRSVLFPVPNEWFGIGLVEPVIGLVHELNTVRRQRLDNVNLILNRMWKVLSYADIDLDTVVSSPNGIIITDDMNGIEALATPNVTESAYQEAASIQQDIDSATAPKSIQGTPDSGRLGRTAKGAQMIIGQALEKFGTAVRMIEETSVKRIIRMFHQLNMQFIDDDDKLREPGLYGSIFDEKVTVEMIRAEFKVKILGISDIMNKEGKINQIISFFGVFKQFMAPPTIKAVMEKVWRLMGFKPSDIELSVVLPQSEGTKGGAPSPQTSDQNQVAELVSQLTNNGEGGSPAIKQ